MAQLTDYLSSSGGAKPIIPTQVEGPDIFGAVANLAKGYLANRPDPADAARAARQAKNDQFEDDKNAAQAAVAKGLFDLSTGTSGGNAPKGLNEAMRDLQRMERSGMDPVTFEAQKNILFKRVLDAYPDQAHNVFSWVDENDMSGYLPKQMRDQLAFDKTVREATNNAVGEMVKTLANRGVDITLYSTEDIITMESAARTEEELRRQASEKLAYASSLMTYNNTQDETARKANERLRETAGQEYLQSSFNLVNSNWMPVYNTINTLMATSKDDDAALLEVREFVSTTAFPLLSKMYTEFRADAQNQGLKTEEMAQIDKWYEQSKSMLTDLSTGDFSTVKTKADLLKMMQQGNEFKGRQLASAYYFAVDNIHPSVTSTIVQMIGVTGFAGKDELTQIFQDGLNSLVRGVFSSSLTQNPDGTSTLGDPAASAVIDFCNTMRTGAPVNFKELSKKNDKAFKIAVRVNGAALPDAATRVVKTPTTETVANLSKSVAPLFIAASQISPSTKGDKHMETVATTMASPTLWKAVETAVGVDPKAGALMATSLSRSYQVALRAAMRQENSMSIGSLGTPLRGGPTAMPSSLDPSMAWALGGDSISSTTNPIIYDKTTARFVGGETVYSSGRITTSDANQTYIANMNKLLEGSYRMQVASGRPGSEMSQLDYKNFIVNSLETLADKVVDNLPETEDGWAMASPSDVAQDVATKADKALGRAEQTAKKETSVTGALMQAEEYALTLLANPLSFPTLYGQQAAKMFGDPEVQSLLKVIDATEGGGDYNKLYNNSETSDFSNVKITEMTIDELLDFTALDGDYGQYVAKLRPDPEMGVSTPLGRYQIVGRTLRGLKSALGLTGNEKFSEEIQDQMFLYLYQSRKQSGKNFADEWQGLRGTEWDKVN
jgi:muramidase (phage lysozyme)